MDFDPTSTLVATGSADSTVKVWDVERGYCTHNFKGHSGIISVVRFHPGRRQLSLFSGSDDCKIRVWDLESRSCSAVLDSHVSVVRALDFSPDGRFLVSGGRDKVVNLWNLQSSTLESTLPVFESVETLGVLTVSNPLPDSVGDHGSLVVYTGGDKGIIRIWDVRGHKSVLEQEKEPGSKHEIVGSIYLPATNTIIALTSDQNILFYDVRGGLRRTRQIAGYNEEVLGLSLVGEGDSHLAVLTNSEQIRVYDMATSDVDILYGHTEIVLNVDKSRDGKLLISGARDHKAIVWRFNPEEEPERRFQRIGVCVGHTEPVGAVGFPRKSNSFVLTGSHDRTVKLWDLPDGGKTFTDSEPMKLKARYTFHAHDKDIQSLAVAPNDKVFATAALDKTAKLWSVEDGTLLGTFKGHRRGIWCVKFSPVDQILATCSTDKTIKLWNVTDFSCVKTFEGHLNTVLQISFLSSGMQLVSTSADGLVKLWTIKTNECVATLDNHEDRIWALAVKGDETQVITGAADSTVVVWDDVTQQEEEEKMREMEERVTKEQDLSNFLLKRDYKNAIKLAMDLNQPFKLLGIFWEVIEKGRDKSSVVGSKDVEKVVGEFGDEELEKLLLFIRTWNTNSKHATVAQCVLNLVLTSFSLDRILDLPKAKEILEGLIPYTERHYGHTNQLVTRSFEEGGGRVNGKTNGVSLAGDSDDEEDDGESEGDDEEDEEDEEEADGMDVDDE
ncbi:Transducin (beta)-like 3 [Rhizophlyctis rosea]|nr:Transducin (beta)-like 3 [Rhizophlyctis rosea]